MTKAYSTRKDTIKDALDHVEEFIEKMNIFTKIHPEYNYSISICEVPLNKKFPAWEITTNITKQ